jgi:hypothetical protein
MKEELYNLYSEKQPLFRSVVKKFPFDDLAGPFLMSPAASYREQKHPLLVVGQETNGWSNYIDEIGKQMTVYEKFEVGKETGHSAFWDTTRKIENILGNDPCTCAWTNLSKFDLYGVRTYGKYEKAISVLDDLLAEEIKIVAPQVCFFFTGPYFDARLKNVFKGLQFVPIEGWNQKHFCMLQHEDLPPYTFRSYHPRSLRLNNLEKEFLKHLGNIDFH